ATSTQDIPLALLNLGAGASQITARTQIEAAMDDAIDGGAPIAYAFDDGPAGSVQTMAQLGNTFFPDCKVKGMHTSDILQRALTWMPCCSRRWVYGGTPVCHFYSELRPDNSVNVQGSIAPILAVSLLNGTKLSAKPVGRYDLLVSTVRVYYLGQV